MTASPTSARRAIAGLASNAANDNVEPSPRLIRLRDVMAHTGLSRSAVYRLVSEGDFPPPVKLTERTAAWVTAEVDAWIAERIQRRDQR